jgi:hypothetical protein
MRSAREECIHSSEDNFISDEEKEVCGGAGRFFDLFHSSIETAVVAVVNVIVIISFQTRLHFRRTAVTMLRIDMPSSSSLETSDTSARRMLGGRSCTLFPHRCQFIRSTR